MGFLKSIGVVVLVSLALVLCLGLSLVFLFTLLCILVGYGLVDRYAVNWISPLIKNGGLT